MEKSYRGVLIFLGIAILIGGGFIGDGLSDIANSMNQQYDDSDDTYYDSDYEVIVQDGVIYLYDKHDAFIWKKEDKPNAKWEEIDHVFEDF